MSFGSTAYESYVRIHLESGEPPKPSWHALPHVRRLAWEAAAQAVAMAILPPSLNPEYYEETESGTEDFDFPHDVEEHPDALTTEIA